MNWVGVSKKFWIMGILNVTPDSFYDGGRYQRKEKALEKAFQLIEAGADIVDIGGESTRPGSDCVNTDEELRRVVPVIRRLAKESSIPISIDTTKADVAERAIEAGAVMVNDISGFQMDPRMVKVVAQSKIKCVLTHMQGTPKEMQVNPVYQDVKSDILAFFKNQIEMACSQGVQFEQIMVDPGIGFGKNVSHNLEILRSIDLFLTLGCPVMIGASRKSFIGKILGCSDPQDRLEGSLAAAISAYLKGATYFRVHDVLETKRALKMVSEIMSVS